MTEWKERALERHAQGMRGSQIAKEVGRHHSQISRYLAQFATEPEGDEFIQYHVTRVPRRIIKTNDAVLALAMQFATGLITREELMKGIAA